MKKVYRLYILSTGESISPANYQVMGRRPSRIRIRRLPVQRGGVAVLLLALALVVSYYTRETGTRQPPPSARRQADTARVDYVIDGDTIALIGGERVRYIGIDTPELHPRAGGGPEPFAKAARAANRQLVDGQPVRLVFDQERRDRYRRLLAYVYAGDTFVNLALVEQGLAVAKAYPPNTAHRAEFEAAEARARAAGRGRWHRSNHDGTQGSGHGRQSDRRNHAHPSR